LVDLFFLNNNRKKMIYILFSILSSTSLFVIFKLANKLNLNIKIIIVLNYLIASLLGYLLSYDEFNKIITTISITNLISAFLIGTLFIINFVLIDVSTKKTGIAITTVMAKMSVIIPIIFTLIYYSENINLLKILGIITALLAILLTVYNSNNENKKNKLSVIPLILFAGMGATDIIIKFSQASNKQAGISSEVFTTLLFIVSFISGIFWYVTLSKKQKKFNKIDIIYGIILGLINFGSIYFFISALNTEIFSSSVIFGINHTSVVVASVLLGSILFKEGLSKINILGIIFSIISIILLTQS